MLSLKRYQKAVAVVIVGALSLLAHLIPAVEAIPDAAVTAASFVVAVALVFFVPNKIAGMNVDTIADWIIDLHEGEEAIRRAERARAGNNVSAYTPARGPSPVTSIRPRPRE